MTFFPLAVAAALEDELKSLRSRLSAAERLPGTGGRLTAGIWKGMPLLLVRTGVGAAAARRALRQALDNFPLGCCLQLGYAGAVQPELSAGDVIIATELIEARSGGNFPVTPELARRSEAIRRRLGLPGGCGPLLTVPGPALTPAAKESWARPYRALALEMEGAALAATCQAAGVPFLAVRAVLDPLDYQLPESVSHRENPWKHPPLRHFADLARQRLTTFAAAWIDALTASLLTGLIF